MQMCTVLVPMYIIISASPPPHQTSPCLIWKSFIECFKYWNESNLNRNKDLYFFHLQFCTYHIACPKFKFMQLFLKMAKYIGNHILHLCLSTV